MKKKLSIRIFSIFLSLLMVVSILPTGAITASAAGFIARTTKPAIGIKNSRQVIQKQKMDGHTQEIELNKPEDGLVGVGTGLVHMIMKAKEEKYRHKPHLLVIIIKNWCIIFIIAI